MKKAVRIVGYVDIRQWSPALFVSLGLHVDQQLKSWQMRVSSPDVILCPQPTAAPSPPPPLAPLEVDHRFVCNITTGSWIFQSVLLAEPTRTLHTQNQYIGKALGSR